MVVSKCPKQIGKYLMASLPLENSISNMAYTKARSIVKKGLKAYSHIRMHHCSTLFNFIQNVSQILKALVSSKFLSKKNKKRDFSKAGLYKEHTPRMLQCFLDLENIDLVQNS
jgi:hypothetical protein